MDRKRFVLPLLLSVLFILVTTLSAAALEVGEKAPDFELDSTKGGKLSSAACGGKMSSLIFTSSTLAPPESSNCNRPVRTTITLSSRQRIPRF